MRYSEVLNFFSDLFIIFRKIIELVSKSLLQGEYDPANILLRAKWKNGVQFVNVTYPEDDSIKLADLVKFDDKVYVDVSKIEVNLLHTKIKCLVKKNDLKF